MRRPRLAALVLLTTAAATLSAQNPVRRLTSIDALRAYPGYYHLQPVLLRGEFAERGTELVFTADDQELRLLNPSEARTGPVEVRCTMIDVGRLEPGDPRLAGYMPRAKSEEWPRPGVELLLHIASVDRAEPAVTPSVRAIALEPWKFAGQTVTVTGTFRGRNLFGDLPNAPAKSRYDFVLTGTEGAVWVTGLRPRGRGFDLDVDRRLDTNRTLEITGKVGRDHGLVTIAATAIALGTAPAPGTTTVEPAPRLPSPTVQVVFSAPTADETDVALDTAVRIQFSRGLRESSLVGQIRVAYLDERPDDPPIVFKTSYDAATRAIQIRVARPFERFRTVRVELLGGIRAFDDGVFTPWSVTFSTGGR